MIEDFLRRNDGVITLAQALDCGLSRHAVNRRVRDGYWRRCSPGVFFVDDRPFTDSARIRSGVWGLGPMAVASGLAAAWWVSVTSFPPDIVEVTVPRDSHGRARPGIRVRRRDLHDADVVERAGLRTTAVPLTVAEASTRPGGGVKLLDSALQRRVVLPALWTAHLRNKGRYGSPATRRLLRGAEIVTRSPAERLLRDLLKANGIEGWKANARVAGYEVDVMFLEAKVVIEVDGLAYHSDADAFHRDRVKQNAIALAGWQVLRFTWLDLVEYPDRVVATIRRAISAR